MYIYNTNEICPIFDTGTHVQFNCMGDMIFNNQIHWR